MLSPTTRYWGKRDTKLNLPSNSSLSVTLSQADLCTHTTASCSPSFQSPDSLLLNGEFQDLGSPRPRACLTALRTLRQTLESQDPTLPKLSLNSLRIVSTNNFPTAAGLASSAAGFAALVRAVADLFELPSSPEELSIIARQGSGSACRSLLGGYVAWDRGTRDDGQDSMARLVAPTSHWPEMRALILVASATKKGVSSTAGMQATVTTSALFPERAERVAPAAMWTIEKAIMERDFETFGYATMRESNSFHATCLDTFPPIIYMSDTSRAAVYAVEALNRSAGKIVAAYTFDAGPNAVIYHLQEQSSLVLGLFKRVLGGASGWDSRLGREVEVEGGEAPIDDLTMQILRDGVSRVILTSVGEGPVKSQRHLVNDKGEPVKD